MGWARGRKEESGHDDGRMTGVVGMVVTVRTPLMIGCEKLNDWL